MRGRQLQRSFTKPTEQTEKARPFLAQGTSLFRYSDCNLKHPNVGTSGAETNHARAAYRERDDRTSIGLPSGNHWRDASLAPSCEDYVNVVPALRAGTREA